jgi:DUF1365 family protein
VNHAQVSHGLVRHTRLRPVRHAFATPALFVLLPMRSWRADPAAALLARNTWGVLSFRDADHGDGGADALAWLDGLLAQHGIQDAQGEAWLQCFPRVFGRTFKPVSFWYCHRTDGSLRAIVAEVNNTFGERHCYLLDAPAWGHELRAAKQFHVSPFCPVEGGYRFRFMTTPGRDRSVVRIDYDDGHGPLLITSVSGRLVPATPGALRSAALRFPLQCASVVLRIHWHALLLWLRGVPFHRKPAAPDQLVAPQGTA